VQLHESPPHGKCFRKGNETLASCKYGVPQDVHLDAAPALSLDTDRYIYRCEHEEDRRLSPYVAEWLLAWGASINVQWCTGAAFLSYISKCALHTSIPPACVVL
jgi:hypothetical protein